MQYYDNIISSNIEKVGHDIKDNLLEITFKSGKPYWYQPFNEADMAEFMSAESKGKHFHRHIKGKFACFKAFLFIQDVEFEAICMANARLIGKSGYQPLSYLCDRQGWDFMEVWDKTLGRAYWYDRQNDEYKLAVEERITQLQGE